MLQEGFGKFGEISNVVDQNRNSVDANSRQHFRSSLVYIRSSEIKWRKFHLDSMSFLQLRLQFCQAHFITSKKKD
jgi:hypothetical protein